MQQQWRLLRTGPHTLNEAKKARHKAASSLLWWLADWLCIEGEEWLAEAVALALEVPFLSFIYFIVSRTSKYMTIVTPHRIFNQPAVHLFLCPRSPSAIKCTDRQSTRHPWLIFAFNCTQQINARQNRSGGGETCLGHSPTLSLLAGKAVGSHSIPFLLASARRPVNGNLSLSDHSRVSHNNSNEDHCPFHDTHYN